MDSMEKETKTAITGILASSKFRLNVRQLNQHFRDLMGYNIPYLNLGYDNLDMYLKSLSDTIQVSGQGDYAEVIAISKKSAHVTELVAMQKLPKAKSRYKNHQSNRINYYSYFPQQYPNNQSTMSYSQYYFVPASTSFQPTRQFYTSSDNSPSTNYYNSSNAQSSKSKPQSFSNNHTKLATNSVTPELDSSSTHTKTDRPESAASCTSLKLTGQNANTYFNIQKHVKKDRMAANESVFNDSMQTSNYSPPSSTAVLANQGSIVGDWSNIKSSSRYSSENDLVSEDEIYYSDEEEVNTKVPQSVQMNLRKLVQKHPDGVWCAKVPELYKREFGTVLDYEAYGYGSLVQMCLDLGNAFNCIQPDKSDHKLFDKSQHIASDIFNSIKRSEYLKIRANAQEATEPALPVLGVEELLINVHQSNVPLGVFERGRQIERQWIEPTDTVHSFIDVNIAEVYDPSKFWFNLKRHAAALNQLMDSMQVFYEANAKVYEVPKLALHVGLYISIIFIGEYHRAVIVDTDLLPSKNLFKAYFIDYGTVALVSCSGVCYLCEQFTSLPAQAIRGRLAGIYPHHRHEQWTSSASSAFLQLIINKDLVAQIMRIEPKKQFLDLVLADTSDDEDFFINDALVYEDYGRFMSQEQLEAKPSQYIPVVPYIHLYPTFEELETAKVPCASEMIHFENAHISIDRIYPQYFKSIMDSPKQEESSQEWQFHYDLAEREYFETYHSDSDQTAADSLLMLDDQSSDDKTEPVLVKNRLSWAELASEEEDEIVEKTENHDEKKSDVENLEVNSSSSEKSLVTCIENEVITEIIAPNATTGKITVTKQVLNPEKPPFIPLSEIRPEAVILSTISKKAIAPPPGFKNVRPIPFEEKQIINYNSTPYSHYVGQNLNINPVHQPQLILQNVHSNVMLQEPLYSGSNVNVDLAALLLRTLYQTQGCHSQYCYPYPHYCDAHSHCEARQPNYIPPPHQQYNGPPHQQYNSPLHQQYNGSLPQQYSCSPRQQYSASPHQQYSASPHQQYNNPPRPQYNNSPHQPDNNPHHEQYNGPPLQHYNGSQHQQYNGPPYQQYNGPQYQPHNPLPQQCNAQSPSTDQQCSTVHDRPDNQEYNVQLPQQLNIPQPSLNHPHQELKNEEITYASSSSAKSDSAENQQSTICVENDAVKSIQNEEIKIDIPQEKVDHENQAENNKADNTQENYEDTSTKEPSEIAAKLDKDGVTEEIEEIEKIKSDFEHLQNQAGLSEKCQENGENLLQSQGNDASEIEAKKEINTDESNSEQLQNQMEKATELLSEIASKDEDIGESVVMENSSSGEEFKQKESEDLQNSFPSQENKENLTVIESEQNQNSSLKNVTKHVCENLTVHIINHNNNFYLSVEEIACKILGKSLSIVHIKKMFVGKEYSISFFDINLKKYSHLKEELIEFGLIKKTTSTIIVITVSDVSQFVRILMHDKSDSNNFNAFLSNVTSLCLGK